MGDSSITTVEVDTQLLEELRAGAPGKPDKELIEDLARLQLGSVTVRRLQERFNLPEDEAIAVGVEAVREGRLQS